jgi:hypothetical protein
VRILQSYSKKATTLLLHLLVIALLCAIESGAFYRVFIFRQTLIFCAFPVTALVCAAAGRCALYMPKDSGQGLLTDLLQENYKSLKSIGLRAPV